MPKVKHLYAILKGLCPFMTSSLALDGSISLNSWYKILIGWNFYKPSHGKGMNGLTPYKKLKKI